MSRRLTYSHVVSTLALVVALGGSTAYAAGLAKNSVASRQIKNAAVKTVDIKPDAVTGALVAPDTLTGADVAEGSLAKVPAAGVADTADRLGGLAPVAFQRATAHALVAANCTVVSETGGVTVTDQAGGAGVCLVSFPTEGTASSFAVSISRGLGGTEVTGEIAVSLCGGPPLGVLCSFGPNTRRDVLVNTRDSTGVATDIAFWITKFD